MNRDKILNINAAVFVFSLIGFFLSALILIWGGDELTLKWMLTFIATGIVSFIIGKEL